MKYDAIKDQNIMFCVRCGRIYDEDFFEDKHAFLFRNKKAGIDYYLCFNF